MKESTLANYKLAEMTVTDKGLCLSKNKERR